MPADKPNIGKGRRRQGPTDPDNPDDRNRSLERAIKEDETDTEFHRGKQAGAHDDPRTPSRSNPANLNDTNMPPPDVGDRPPGSE